MAGHQGKDFILMGEPSLRRMTVEEFLGWQAKQDCLFELVDGVPVLPLKMMTGASQAHDRVVVNIIRDLSNQLRRSPCRPTTDDLAVRIPAGNIRRPDVTVECGQAGRNDLTVQEPRAVFEVLSPSTMSFDRFRKVLEYQTIETLAYIVLVDTEAPRVDVISRASNGNWSQQQYEGVSGQIAFPAFQASLDLADVFEGLEFAEQGSPHGH